MGAIESLMAAKAEAIIKHEKARWALNEAASRLADVNYAIERILENALDVELASRKKEPVA